VHVRFRRIQPPEHETIPIADDASLGVPAETPDYLERNREAWERWAPDSAAVGAKAWRGDELRWGMWNRPESELRLLDALPASADVVELGCGAGALCAWLARQYLRPVGVDFSALQLKVAEHLQVQNGISFPLIHANVEDVPFDRESFDAAISEYGASTWCDPCNWLGEAHRLLRPDGYLIFFTAGAMLNACTPEDGGRPGEKLVRNSFSSRRVELGADMGVRFCPTHGEWVRQLGANGFSIEALIETRPPSGAESRYAIVDPEWARRWPSEEIWVARKVKRAEADKRVFSKPCGDERATGSSTE
jgi:SAM-dependent methyltransferase